MSAPVTGYPAHSAPPYYYPTPHAPPYISPRAALRRRLFAALLAAVVISGTILFITYIILRPQIPRIAATSLSLSSFNLTPSSLLSATWHLTLTVTNPNRKITLAYDRIEASVFYRSEFLSETTLPPFSQPKKNQTVITANFVSAGAYVEQGIGRERIEKGIVEFNVGMSARVRYRAGAWRARPRFLRVYCKGLTVVFSGNGGEMAGGARKCRVGL